MPDAAVQALALTVRLPPHLVGYLWIGLIWVLVLSAAVTLILLLIGPWQNRLAGSDLLVILAKAGINLDLHL